MFTIRHRNPPPPPIKKQLNQNNMKILTPVEWFVSELRNGKELNDNLINKAIELEKEHFIYAYNFQKKRPSVNLTAEQYYYETFKSE